MSRRLLLVAALVVTPSLAFAGPSKAWNAAKKIHPEGEIIAGIDVASAKSTESFKKFYPLLIASKPQIKDVLDKLQTACKFDPFTAIGSAVAVIQDQAKNKGAFYIALAGGWNAAKLAACAQKLSVEKGKSMTVRAATKNVQEYSITGSDDKIFVGTVGKDVIVVTTDPTDQAFVETMMAGKGGGDAGKLAAKLDTSATVWMSVMKTNMIQPGLEMKALYGTVKVAKGTMNADLHVVMGDDKQPPKIVDEFKKSLPQVQSSLPPAAAAMMKSLKMKAVGTELQATTSAPEKDVLDLLSLFLKP